MANNSLDVYRIAPGDYDPNSYDKIIKGKKWSKIGIYITIIMVVLLGLFFVALFAGLLGIGLSGLMNA